MQKACVVAGGGSGIGSAVVERLLTDGWNVLLTDRDISSVAELASAHDGRLELLEADISDAASGAKAIERCLSAFGAVDAMVNAAGITAPHMPLDELPAEDFLRVIAVNQTGCYHMMKAAIAHMRTQGRGAIVNIGSSAGIMPYAMSATYSGTKAAMIAMSKAAAIESAPMGVRINVVCPGLTDTPLYRKTFPTGENPYTEKIPLRRAAASSEIAAAVVWLLTDEASYITGAVLPVDGGLVLI